MAEPERTAPSSLLLLALEAWLQHDPETGKPRYGMRTATIDAADQPPAAFPAALVCCGTYERDAAQELVWPLTVVLMFRAPKARNGYLDALEAEHQLVHDLLDSAETLADGWCIDTAWGGGPQRASVTDPNNPKAGRELFYVSVVTLTARRLD